MDLTGITSRLRQCQHGLVIASCNHLPLPYPPPPPLPSIPLLSSAPRPLPHSFSPFCMPLFLSLLFPFAPLPTSSSFPFYLSTSFLFSHARPSAFPSPFTRASPLPSPLFFSSISLSHSFFFSLSRKLFCLPFSFPCVTLLPLPFLFPQTITLVSPFPLSRATCPYPIILSFSFTESPSSHPPTLS